MIARLLPTLFLLLGWTAPGQAQELSEILLRDGSRISGEILSFDGDRYRLTSESLGTLSIDHHQIEQIRSLPDSGAGRQAAPIARDRMHSLQQQLVTDPETMALIQSLQDDPQIQEIINDPQLLQAIMAGDLQTLRDSPKLQGLMNNPSVRKIQERTAP